MPQELQIKALLLDLENRTDKNGNPYCRISLSGMPGRYFYAFSNSLPETTFTSLTNTPHNLVNRQVLITYQELPNQDYQGIFGKVKQIEIL